jgi:hypothetical protein
MKIEFNKIETQRIARGKWVSVVECTKPFKVDVILHAESEILDFHKMKAFFEDERLVASQHENKMGGITYILSDEIEKD